MTQGTRGALRGGSCSCGVRRGPAALRMDDGAAVGAGARGSGGSIARVWLRRLGAGLLIAFLTACGGRQVADEEVRERAPAERPTCVPQYWEVPPARIGEVPPDRGAPDQVLESFRYRDPLSGEEAGAGEGAPTREREELPGDSREPLPEDPAGAESPAGDLSDEDASDEGSPEPEADDGD